MCYALYIGSDSKLPLISWEKEKPAFFVDELKKVDEPVRNKFSKNYIFYVGSWEGCGCGFNYDPVYHEPDQIIKNKQSFLSLMNYINDGLRNSELEMYCCWEEKQGNELEQVKTISINPDDKIKVPDTFELEEMTLIKIERSK